MDIRKLIGAVSVLALVGCASAPQGPAEVAVQKTIDDIPKWYVELPEVDEDEKVLYLSLIHI